MDVCVKQDKLTRRFVALTMLPQTFAEERILGIIVSALSAGQATFKIECHGELVGQFELNDGRVVP